MHESPGRARLAFALVAAFFVAWFLWFGGDSLRTDLTHDDLMNGWRGWFSSWQDQIRDTFFIWRVTPNYRPFGTLAYKVFFTISGLDLRLMRAFLACLILFNAYLVYALARRLSGSREAGALAALLHANHSGLSHLYYNTGTCFDIFCFTFYFGALLYYVQIRQAGRYPRLAEGGVLCLLLILGLSSKEMAVTLPVLLALYEVIFHRPPLAGKRVAGWLPRAAAIPAVTVSIVLLYAFGRVLAPEGISRQGGYHPVISLAQYLTTTGGYLGQLFNARQWFSSYKVIAFLLAGLALMWRSKAGLYGWFLFAAGILPMAFIPLRGVTAIYIPHAGLAIWGAVMLVRLRDGVLGVARRISKRAEPGIGTVFGLYDRKAFVMFVALAVVLFRVHTKYHTTLEPWLREQTQIRSFLEQWRQLHPSIPKGGRVLILKDPFGGFNWASIFIGHFIYREIIVIDRLPSMKQRPEAKSMPEYTHVLTYEDGQLRDATPEERAGAGLSGN
jgi:hypothetical protein